MNATEWTVLMHWACTTHFGREQRGAVSALMGLMGCWSKWEGQQSFPGPGKRLVLGLQNCWLTLSHHTQTTSFAVSHRLWSKICKKGKWCVKIELRWEELDSSLTGNIRWVCHFNLSIDNGVSVCRMLCSQMISLFIWDFGSHAGRGKCLIWDGWKLNRKEGGTSQFNSRECVSLGASASSEATWKLWSEKTERDQKNSSKTHLPMCPESNTTILADRA